MRISKKLLLLRSHRIFLFFILFIQDKIYNTLFLGYLEREFVTNVEHLEGKEFTRIQEICFLWYNLSFYL
jgi:hypothetical protein